MHTNAVTAPSGLSDGPYDTAVRGGSGPSESHPLQPGPPPPRKGTGDDRTATALGDVAWAAAVFPSNPPGVKMGDCQCLTVVRS